MSVQQTRDNKKYQSGQEQIAYLFYVWEQKKRVIVNSCSLEKCESKSVNISVSTNKVKCAMNEAKDEEPSVKDNSVINGPSYFKIFKCGKNFLRNLDATYK